MKSKLNARMIAIIVVSVTVSTLIAHYDTLLPYRWHTYTSRDGAFSIDFPAKPATETTQVPRDGGSIAINEVSANPNSRATYSCVYFDDEGVAKGSAEDVLTSARDGSLQKTQGTLVSEKKITVDGFPGLEYEANTRGNTLLDSRLIVAGGRTYMIASVASPASNKEEKTVNRFMQSFRILNSKSAR